MPERSIAFRDFPDAWFPDWIESLRRVEAMDFEIPAPGHGRLGKKEDVALFREYLEGLRGQVRRYAREGKILDEMKPLIQLAQYES